MKWIEIKRDSDGFADEQCLAEMFSELPIAVYDKENDDYEIVTAEHYLYEWRGDIDRHPRYSHYLRIPNKCKNNKRNKVE